MKKLFVGVSVGFLCLSSFAVEAVELLEFVETTGYEYADTGIYPNPAKTRVKANFQVVELPAKSDGQVAVFGCTPTKGNYTCNENCTVRYGWNNGYSQWRVCPTWTGSADGGYYVSGMRDREGMEIECYQATAWVNGTKVGGYYDAGRPDTTLDCSLYIGNINNANDGLVTAAGKMPKIRWYRFEIWTDGVLVADFVAAKKGADVGFYDKVNGGFIASAVDGKPFIAPNRVEWTGGGSITDPADTANWKGGVAPTATDVAYIPAGHTLTSNYAQVTAFFNNLVGVSFADKSAGLMLTNGDVAVTMTCPLYGKGNFTVANSLCTASADYKLSMYSANYMYAGTMLVSNAAVHVQTKGGSGSHIPAGPGGTVIVNCSDRTGASDKRRYTVQGGFQSCKYVIRRASGSRYIIHEGTSFYGDFDFNEGLSWSFHGNTGYQMSLYGDVCYTNAVRKTLSIENGSFGFYGGATATKHLGLLQVSALNVSAPMAFAPQAKDSNMAKQYNLLTGTSDKSSYRALTFGLANVFPTNVFLLVNNGQVAASGRYAPMDLNGFDQRIGTLGVYAKSDFDPATAWNDRLTIESATPATLTIYGNCRCDAASAKHVYPGAVKGALSVVMDSRSDVNVYSVDGEVGQIRFNCPGSDTTGTLTAKSGTLEVMPTATFANVPAIVASGDGLVKVGTAAIGTACDGFLVSVTNATTAKIEIDAGVTLACDTAYMGTGWLPAGRYSSQAGAGVRACPRLAGEGILEVRRYGGKSGLVISLQ